MREAGFRVGGGGGYWYEMKGKTNSSDYKCRCEW